MSIKVADNQINNPIDNKIDKVIEFVVNSTRIGRGVGVGGGGNFGGAGGAGGGGEPVQTTWDLVISVNGLSFDTNLFRIQLFGTGPNITVEWGDGSVETFNTTGNKDHLYASTGLKTIKISGSFVANGRIVVRRSPTNAAQIYSTSVIPHIPNLTSFQDAFRSQTALDYLAPLPERLFANNPQLTGFRGCFLGCAFDGPDIPTGLFANNVNVTDFTSCFSQIETLTSIPAGLFANNVNVTTFASCFGNSYILTEIPTGLFTNNPLVTSFAGCFNEAGIFSETSSLTIPVGLFDNNLNVTSFASCFQSANLTTVPSGLFANNVNVTTFNGVFNNLTLTTESYSNLLINIASNAAARLNNVAFGGGGSKYNLAGADARAILAAKPWTITDGGPA